MGTLSRVGCESINAFQFNQSNLSMFDHQHADMPGIFSQNQTHLICAELEETPVAGDYFDGVYEYIKRMLMEEDDLDHRPCMFQDCSALQAAEKSFYDALSDKDSHSSTPLSGINTPTLSPTPGDHDHDYRSIESAPAFSEIPLSDPQLCTGDIWTSEPLQDSCDLDWLANSPQRHFQLLNSQCQETCLFDENLEVMAGNGREVSGNFSEKGGLGTKKCHDRCEKDGSLENRSNKQLAGYTEDSEPMDKYDKSLLCPKMNPNFYSNRVSVDVEEVSDEEDQVNKQYRQSTVVKRGRPKGSKKNTKAKEVVDLRGLLTRCAEAVSNFNTFAAEEFLKQIRQYSSPYGDPNERLAHIFANALEARIAGTGTALYTASTSRRIPAAELLKSYQSYVTCCPFKRMSNIVANKTIAANTLEADKIHIIDFGILYGFQWPCIIHGISLKPGGPPTLRITGIDFPQPGFKPAERVEQTGHRLTNVCKRFNVPFEYNAIVKRWDSIRVEDLKIKKDEMVIVNCLYRLRHMPDECAGMNSPRDAVLQLVKDIKPKLFVHGVLNGSHNAPFFATRFREALFHYSSFFDMLEATLPREDQDRLLYEREVFGRDIMNVIACEGSERVERPDTYKHWQLRNQRAGFRQIPLINEVMREVKIKVAKSYHNDFLLDEDSGWMLQGWKGRVLYALSFWKPLEQ